MTVFNSGSFRCCFSPFNSCIFITFVNLILNFFSVFMALLYAFNPFYLYHLQDFKLSFSRHFSSSKYKNSEKVQKLWNQIFAIFISEFFVLIFLFFWLIFSQTFYFLVTLFYSGFLLFIGLGLPQTFYCLVPLLLIFSSVTVWRHPGFFFKHFWKMRKMRITATHGYFADG